MQSTQTHLGDGVYARYDGYHILLSATGAPDEAENHIWIEPAVLQALDAWIRNGYTDYNSGQKFGADGP